MSGLPEELIFREPNSGCWLWEGPYIKNSRGYGTHGGHVKGREYLTHRIAYIATNGPIPAKQVVMHKCDTPACVNPNHLTIGTQQENINDMGRKGRGLHKLTNEQALEVLSSPLSGYALGKKFGVNKSSINSIRRGQCKSLRRWLGEKI